MPQRDRLVPKHNFILQQGFAAPSSEVCPMQYSALLFQPRAVGLVVLLGILLQLPVVFFGLAAVLWWSALLPRLNPFDALYNVTLGARPHAVRLGPAPPPRRFAQALAGSLSVAIGVALLAGHRLVAYGIEAFLAAAIVALGLGGFCFGSFVFHLLRGRSELAMRTLPWARGR